MAENEGWDKKTIALAAFILFGSGSGIGNLFIPELRQGSFTRADFEKEKASIVMQDEIAMDKLRHRITLLEAQSRECRRRIAKCEDR